MNDLQKQYEKETGNAYRIDYNYDYVEWLENKAKQRCCKHCDFYYDCYEAE